MNSSTDPCIQQSLNYFKTLLNKEFKVYRNQRIPDGQGGFTEALVLVSSFWGRLSTKAGISREPMVGGKWEAQVDYVLYTLAGLDIRRHDHVTGYGKTLRVLEIKEPSLAQHHYEIGCEEIQTGR